MGKFRRKDQQSAQEELWLRPQELVKGPHDGFYSRLESVLAKLGFTESVHRHCAPYYKTGTPGFFGNPPTHGKRDCVPCPALQSAARPLLASTPRRSAIQDRPGPVPFCTSGIG